MKKLILLLLVISVFSCTKQLDFDQAKQLNITPVFEGDIFYLDLGKDNLTDQTGTFRDVVKDTIDFGIFKDGKVRDAFVKAEIYVKYKNSFQRNFKTIVSYIDENKQQVDADTLNIIPANVGQNVEGEEVYTYVKALNPDFINFRKIVVKIEVSPDTQPIEDEHIHLQSKGIFYTKYTIE